MTGSSPPDIAVIGGGAIGVCAALELARSGARVTLLERGGALAWECSGGNAGLICPSHAWPLATPAALRAGLRWMLQRDGPFAIRPRPALLPWLVRYISACRLGRAEDGMMVIRELSLASLDLHRTLVSAGVMTGLEQRGIVYVYSTEQGFAAARAEAVVHARAGIRSHAFSGAQVTTFEPMLAGMVAGGMLYPDEAHCDPTRFVDAVGEAAREVGVDIRLRSEVLGFRREGGRVQAIETTEGTLAADVVVLAAGACSPRLARDLGVFLPIEGGKGYHVDLESRLGDPTMPLFLQEAHVVATPLPGRLRLAGMLELTGCDMTAEPTRIAGVLRSATRSARGLEGRRVVHVWRGLRPCAPDGLPVVGRPSALENVVIATGHAMMGLTLAPITGRLVSELVAGKTPSHDLTALQPDRFRPLGDLLADAVRNPSGAVRHLRRQAVA